MGTLTVSDNFDLHDVQFNEWAHRLGIDNVLPLDLLENAEALAQNVLEPLLVKFPDLAITSWYRSEALERDYSRRTFALYCVKNRLPINQESWGVYMVDNQHASGGAATIRVRDLDAAFEFIQSLEFDVLQHKTHWLSVSFSTDNRNRVINK